MAPLLKLLGLLLVSTTVAYNNHQLSPINVNISSAYEHPVSRFYMGCHSDSGYSHQPRGLYSQLILGESFEEDMEGICGSHI